jgi:putative peptide zinc metalloprotease protein
MNAKLAPRAPHEDFRSDVLPSPALCRLQLNPLVRIREFDDAAMQRRWLYELEDASGRFQRIAIPDSVHAWLGDLDGERDLEDVLSAACETNDAGNQRRRLRELVTSYLVPNRILVTVGETALHAATRSATPHWMLARLRLFPPAVVNPVARLFAPLYLRWLLLPALLAIVLGQIGFFVALSSAPASLPFDGNQSTTLVRAMLLAVLGLFAHEFGHAAAAYHHGCRRTEIGVGWYLCFPVLYADLSESWRCSRRQRLVIDAGGVYFQALATALLMGWYWIQPDPALLYASVLLNISLAFNLNPFLRMDGYWLASDALGVSNLRQVAAAAIRRRFRPRTGPAPATPYGERSELWLLAFATGSSLFLAAVVYFVSTNLLWRVIDAIPGYQGALWAMVRHGGSAIDYVVAIVGLLWQLLLLVFLCWFLAKTALAALALLKRLILDRKRRSRALLIRQEERDRPGEEGEATTKASA